MIDIYLRHAINSEGQLVASVAWDQVEKFFTFVQKWGVSYEGDSYEGQHMTGNFVLDDAGGAYFEIVIEL